MLKENLNPEEKLNAFNRPTIYKTATNIHPLHCRECARLYYVDEDIYRRAVAGFVGDLSEVRFVCEACESGYGEEAHGH
ncbi:MAG: hypothetical protein AB1757_09300 [Acidobacteriota bacterium]